MNPDDKANGQGGEGGAIQPSYPSHSTPTDTTTDAQREAATNILRSQIDSLYTGGSQVATAAAPTAEPKPNTNPYLRTHTPSPQPQADEWKAYHTAWQNYYQQYYEGYYTHQVKEVQKTLPQQRTTHSARHYFGSQPAAVESTPEDNDQPLTKDEALFDLRQKLLGRVQESARKVRKSRHFVPIISAAIVVLAFVFIQYNSFVIGTVAAYISPGSIDPQNIVIDPNADIEVGPEPRLIIPKINVDVPVSYDIGNDHASQMAAMRSGVAHFAIPGASSHPGEVGNTVIAGHSSNDAFTPGDYKFIFVQLEKLTVGDTIYANYNGTRYTYTVTRMQTVKPTEVGALIYETSKPELTLITCTPIGTALNRLLVTAEQVSPDPTKATESTNDNAPEPAQIPGNNATLLERLFGAEG